LLIEIFDKAIIFYAKRELDPKVPKGQACLKMELKICIAGCKRQGKRQQVQGFKIDCYRAFAAPLVNRPSFRFS
jgi:hypothetical protein